MTQVVSWQAIIRNTGYSVDEEGSGIYGRKTSESPFCQLNDYLVIQV